MKKEKLRLGLVGFGNRGMALLRDILLPMSRMDVVLCGVCDGYADRVEAAAQAIQADGGTRPFCTTDYHELVAMDVDAVVVMTAWESHVAIAVAAMQAGKAVAMEVGGAYSVADCWRLVDTAESTGMPCMLLENCCYGKRELMALRMAREGFFGEIPFCEGGYHHDLRAEIAYGAENRHYRLRNYLHRNAENYPTHELGPIAKLLHINDGNRMLSLTAVASCARGMHAYVLQKKGAADTLAGAAFAQGDVVKTAITCAGGELIELTLDTTLPRTYSRGFTVRGTRGAYFEDTDAVFEDGRHNAYEFRARELWGNAAKYEARYRHLLWENYTVKGGHDGIDWLVFRAFIEAVKAGVQPPIDVYDAAAWMCVSALSEQSIAAGGAPQAIPDFTRGRWMERTDIAEQPYSLR